MDFALIPQGAVRHLNVPVGLADLPPGLRCRFHMYQDEKGAFTRASLIGDEFSHLAANATTYRIESVLPGEGKLRVARQLPKVKNYNGDMEVVPDIGRTELRVDAETRVWKGDGRSTVNDLAVGDVLLVNVSGELPGRPSKCLDVWVGEETHKRVIDAQRAKFAPAKPKKKR